MKRMPRVPPGPTRETFWRTLQTFSITRIVITVVLLAYLGLDAVRKVDAEQLLVGWHGPAFYLLFALAATALAFYWRRRFYLQLLTQVALDIAAISLLYLAAGGAKSGLAILYLFPLAGCAILAPTIVALFFVALVSLFLLGESGLQVLHASADASPSRAGLFGAAFFAAIYVINRLAAKLIKQEELAAQRGRDLQMQEAINRLVIADMGDGILVVGKDGAVLAGNPAAERMLAMPGALGRQAFRLAEVPALAPIADAFGRWRSQHPAADGARADGSAYVVVKPGPGRLSALGKVRREPASHLKLRFAKVAIPEQSEERSVVFLQDVTEIENQAQQLKLASMGRLTASIAHEVRNPLSAISHAASLLKEDATDASHQRLLKIVGDNVVRLNSMIEDILKLARKAHTQEEPLALAPFFTEILNEFRETHAVAPGLIELADMSPYRVRFDPLHLREVVVNLLTNALRYASGNDGSIRIRMTAPTERRLELHVQDDGPPISPEVRAHLFEPFYTTSSKGTGLGLYVARELCLNNGAILDYEYRMAKSADGMEQPSGRFVISFPVLDPL